MVKTVTITEEAYLALASNKHIGESFSALIKRSFVKKGDISKFLGAWSDMEEKDAEKMKAEIEKRRWVSGKERRREILKHLV